MGFLGKGLFKGVSFRFTSLTACLFLIFFASTLILPISHNASLSLKHAFATESPAPAGEHAAPVLSKAEGKPEEGKKEGEGKFTYQPAPKIKVEDYPIVKGFNSRIAVWIVAQLHLFFGAFVLAVPIFVLVIEGVGLATKDERYDHMAHEFIKVSMTAFSITASLGGLLSLMLVSFYPDFFKYMAGIFGKTMIIYALLFFGESFCLYVYYYGWDRMNEGFSKWLHLTMGLMLNVFGMTLMVLSNTWVSFMMAPSGIDDAGVFTGDIWAAIRGPLWNPINLHRFIANIAFGGSIVGAYAAFKFLSAKTDEEKAHYDWMGYTANFIAIFGFLPLPFAGYWLMKEVYGYSQQMGITAMGGAFAWLFIIQAVLIGSLFLGANYYLWCGMGRIKGSERYTPAIKYLIVVIVGCFLVWFTPHTLIMTSKEVTQVGGTHHPVLGFLGVMSAKNTAVNILIVSTFLSFMLYRRSNKIATASWTSTGNALQVALFAGGAINIVTLGVYGYFIPANIRIGLSIPQVMTTLTIIIVSSVLDGFMYKGAKSTGPIEWGKMGQRSQYALFLLAVSFTWLMGLMGYVRSALRQHWHVYTVFRDNSLDAYTPTLGYAAGIITIAVYIFIALVIFAFWIANFSAKKHAEASH
ncbi:MAG: cytochrome ubiquinol oxidase subunit I [Nitrospinae bacterium]|nr:cytochrome ubiquinol oxidase subunit I [Nitrospinota bacterium]